VKLRAKHIRKAKKNIDRGRKLSEMVGGKKRGSK